jgi:hypothetical protein
MRPLEPAPVVDRLKELEEEVKAIKEKEEKSTENDEYTLETKQATTLRVPRGTKLTMKQALALVQQTGVYPMGEDGSHEVGEYVVRQLAKKVEFPTKEMSSRDRQGATARVLQNSVAIMYDTCPETRNMMMASDQGYRMVYTYQKIQGANQTAMMCLTLEAAVRLVFTETKEKLCALLAKTMKGDEWKKAAEVLEDVYKTQSERVVEISKAEMQRLFGAVCVGNDLLPTAWWREETERAAGRKTVVTTKT